MTALWIILAIALVLTLLNLLPVGVDAAYAEGVFSLVARIGPARLHLLPKAPDAKPGKARTKKPKKKKEKNLREKKHLKKMIILVMKEIYLGVKEHLILHNLMMMK